jgi:hypothetical protein
MERAGKRRKIDATNMPRRPIHATAMPRIAGRATSPERLAYLPTHAWVARRLAWTRRHEQGVFVTDAVSRAWCADCGYGFPNAGVALASPHPRCPDCGSDAKRAEVLVQETVGVAVDSVSGIGYGTSKNKWFVKFHNRREFFRLTGRWHAVERTFDKRADRYLEHITDAVTGEVVRHSDEPLSKHQNRGSAARRPGTDQEAPRDEGVPRCP